MKFLKVGAMLLFILVLMAFVVDAVSAKDRSPFIGEWSVRWYTQDPQQNDVYWPMIGLEATWIFTENTLTSKDYDLFGQWAKGTIVSYSYTFAASNKPIDQHFKLKDVDIDFTYVRLNSTAQFFYENNKWVVKSTPANVIRIFMPKEKDAFYGNNVAYMLELTKVESR
jgi:hypothetical protein